MYLHVKSHNTGTNTENKNSNYSICNLPRQNYAHALSRNHRLREHWDQFCQDYQ